MVFIGLVLVWGFLGFYQVDEKENAVVLRLGEYSETIEDPGLKWNPPLIDKVYTVGVTEERQYSTRGLMLTQDENIVEVALAVQYNIASAKDFVLSIRSPETTLKQATGLDRRPRNGSSQIYHVFRHDLAPTPGKAAKAMLEHRRDVLTPRGRPSSSPYGSLVFAPRCVEAPL